MPVLGPCGRSSILHGGKSPVSTEKGAVQLHLAESRAPMSHETKAKRVGLLQSGGRRQCYFRAISTPSSGTSPLCLSVGISLPGSRLEANRHALGETKYDRYQSPL